MNPSKSHHCFPMCFSALLNLYNCPTLRFSLTHTQTQVHPVTAIDYTQSDEILCLFCFAMQNKVVYTDGTIMKISAAVVFLAVHVVCSYLCWWSHISGHLGWDLLRSHPKNMVWGVGNTGKNCDQAKSVIAVIGWSCCQQDNTHLQCDVHNRCSHFPECFKWVKMDWLIAKQTTHPLRHHFSLCLNQY